MILLIGANSMLAYDIKKKLDSLEIEYVCCDHKMLDISCYEDCEKVITDVYDVIINCAAYTNVDLAEQEVLKAYKVNSVGPKNISQCANKIGAKVVHISTDYVFDGKEGNYGEYDNCNPTSVYGKTKLLGENYTRQYCNGHFILRTAWLFGSGGNNFIKTMLSLKENQEIKVVDDQVGQPTATVDLANMIIKLIDTQYYGIYHVTSKGSTSWYNFAKYVFELTKSDVKLAACKSEEFSSKAKRPNNSVLNNLGLMAIGHDDMPIWQDAVKNYLLEEELL